MISKDKQYRTRDGREVRIYATDGCGSHKIHGAVKNSNGWQQMDWTVDGLYLEHPSQANFDLIEIKPRIQREYWMNVYAGSVYDYRLFPTKEIANDSVEGHTHRIACVKVVIDCEEGEGL